ncbi:MAG: 16S rRNA (uracil(1498)-N(3))-methyltransferase [bacterium]|nr:16S rRNA (uracil(1498)-N(3))-methyltransferase [bacterium]
MSDIPILFIPDLKMGLNSLDLNDEAFHHMRRVLRLRTGDQLELRNGKGLAATAVIGEATKKHARLEILSSAELPRPRQPRLRLALPLLKGKRLDWVLEKTTELGVEAFHLFIGDHGVVRRDKGYDRYSSIVTSAFCQCRRALLPEIHDPVPFADLMQLALANDWRGFWADECLGMTGGREGTTPVASNADQPSLAWIGPEGGFSEGEREALTANAHALSLGPNRLRSETAAVALACRLLLQPDL